MKVKDVMTPDPATCTPDAPLAEVARLMALGDCGAIPVVTDRETRELLGIVTDRDIVLRVVAQGRDTGALAARNVMSSPVARLTPEDPLSACCALMEENQVRRVPVVDQNGSCVGIVSLADIAEKSGRWTAAAVLRQISRPVKKTVPA